MTTLRSIELRAQKIRDRCGGGGGGGCECGGVATVWNAVTGEFVWGSWLLSKEKMSEEEASGRETGTSCPRCGKEVGPQREVAIKTGGPIAGPREESESRRARYI